MTALLEKAVARASSLPSELQDELAAVMIEEIDSELRWEQQFAKSPDKLSQLGHKALDDFRNGRTQQRGFDEL